MLTSIIKYFKLKQGFTNPGLQIVMKSNVCTVVPNTFWSIVLKSSKFCTKYFKFTACNSISSCISLLQLVANPKGFLLKRCYSPQQSKERCGWYNLLFHRYHSQSACVLQMLPVSGCCKHLDADQFLDDILYVSQQIYQEVKAS